MSCFDFSKIISEKTGIEEINTKTLAYRINGIIHACNYCITNCEKIRQINVINNSFGRILFRYDNKSDLSIFASEMSNDKGVCIHLDGNYDNLEFSISNYPNNKNLDKKIREIPFNISIQQYINNSKYEIYMNSLYDKIVRFIVIRDDKRICFYASVLDFAMILNLIKSFVVKPDLVFNSYEEIMDKKRIVFTNNELNKVVEKDERFEKPTSKFVKKVKMISNNH